MKSRSRINNLCLLTRPVEQTSGSNRLLRLFGQRIISAAVVMFSLAELITQSSQVAFMVRSVSLTPVYGVCFDSLT